MIKQAQICLQLSLYAKKRLLQIKYLKMKKIIITVFLLSFYALAQAQDMKGMDMTKKETKQQPVTYTCPMHPEIHSAKPGNCLKCGMKLVKEKPK